MSTSIRHRQTGHHFCGGILISPRSILTAAYCVSPTAFNINPEVWCGDIQDINNSRGSVDVLRAVKTTLHECYDPRRYFNDIAVLELNASIVHGKPIGNIITVAEFESLQPGDQLVGLGWGRTTNDSTTTTGASTTTATAAAGFPKSLQQAVLPFISDQACNTPESYNNTVDSDLMFCAGYFDGRADACAGDSGGPLVQHAVSRKKNHSDNNSRKMNNTGDTLVGIVSWGEGCGVKGHPGVYARVDVHHDWIVLHSHCACSTIERFNYTRGPGNNSSECILIEESGEVAVEHKADISAAAGSSTATPTATGQPPGLCYVVNFEKCPLATASQVFPGKGWLPCRKNSQGEVETIHNATSCSFRGGP